MTVDEARAALLRSVTGRCIAPDCPSQHEGDGLDCIVHAAQRLEAAVRAEYSEHVDRYQYETDTAMDWGDGYAQGRAEAGRLNVDWLRASYRAVTQGGREWTWDEFADEYETRLAEAER